MPIQIYILCKLMEGDNYPYRLKKQLSDTIPLAQIGGLTENKLYYNFESLAKQGFIEPVELIKEENRPDKQVYAITEKGRAKLPQKIYSLFEQAKTTGEMVIGLAYLEYVDRKRVLEILEQKLQSFNERWEIISKFKINDLGGKENFLNFMQEYANSSAEHTRYWLEQLIDRLKQGEI